MAAPRNAAQAWLGAIVPFLVAFVLIGIGISDFGNEVSCGNRTMRPGDMCRVTHNGENKLKGYETMRRDQHDEAPFYLGGGILALVAGGFAVVRLVRWRAARRA